MAKEKVTLTLDHEQVEELRALVGARSLSAAVNSAVAAHLVRLRHQRAMDEWLAELDDEHGPVGPEDQVWAAGVVDAWEGRRSGPRRQAG